MTRALYSWLLRALLPVIFGRLLWRGRRNPQYWRGWPERLGYIRLPPGARRLWIHAVSVGEVHAAVPLVQALSERYPQHPLLVTTMTPTGLAQARALFGDRVAHGYVPYDLPAAVRRFLDRACPDLAIVMETELWPNIFHLCRARGIPLMVANLRLSAAATRRYRRVAGLTRDTLRQANVFAAQSRADAERLIMLGAPPERVHVLGSIKFEFTLPASLREAAEVLRGQWGRDRPVWVAGSTHEGEDEVVLAAFARLRREPRFAQLLLVLVPRHPERFAAVARLCRKSGLRTALRSQEREALDPSVDVLVGDTLGELPLFYGAGDCAFIGGSLVPAGGHNLLEAAAQGRPVVMGPHMFNFAEIATLARERGAAVEVAGAEQLAAAAGDFLGNANRRFAVGEAGRKLVGENRGALARHLDLISGLLAP